jgi:hypothetical protein
MWKSAGSIMTQAERITGVAFGSRIARLPFVLLLIVGLLLSLIHCAGCGRAFASSNESTVVMSIDDGSAPDTPEPQLPCHSGHCLSHVTAQQVATVAGPADLIPRAPLYWQEESPASLAGLPLFKPPRA